MVNVYNDWQRCLTGGSSDTKRLGYILTVSIKKVRLGEDSGDKDVHLHCMSVHVSKSDCLVQRQLALPHLPLSSPIECAAPGQSSVKFVYKTEIYPWLLTAIDYNNFFKLNCDPCQATVGKMGSIFDRSRRQSTRKEPRI